MVLQALKTFYDVLSFARSRRVCRRRDERRRRWGIIFNVPGPGLHWSPLHHRQRFEQRRTPPERVHERLDLPRLSKNFEGVSFKSVLVVSLFGGLTGAVLLLVTPQSTFDIIVPWLLLMATLIFAFGPYMGPRFETLFRITPLTFLPVQFLIGLYAGYFGGAVGLIMLATYSLFGMKDFKVMNASKTLLGGTMNTAAVALFIVAGKVWWPQTAVMIVGATLGGYVGAHAGRRLNTRPVRIIVTMVSLIMTIVFFSRS